jgi:magnesium-transporting ATPase (P-type)
MTQTVILLLYVDKGDHEMPLETLANISNTNLETGLTTAKAQMQLELDGTNELEKPPRISLLMLFTLQFTDLIMALLVAASMTIGGIGDNTNDPLNYVEGIAIMTIVVLNAGIAAVTENSANDALEALSKLTQPIATVPTTLNSPRGCT